MVNSFFTSRVRSFGLLILALLALAAMPSTARAQDWVQFSGNGHWYLVTRDFFRSWEELQASAAEHGGYFATITSAEEDAFVYAYIAQFPYLLPERNGVIYGPWIGGVQDPGAAEPAGGWGWITGEPWSYTNWAPGQPDNAEGSADRLCYYKGPADALPNRRKDVGSDAASPVSGYIIEVDCIWIHHQPFPFGSVCPGVMAPGLGWTVGGTDVTLQWQVLSGDDWTDLVSGTIPLSCGGTIECDAPHAPGIMLAINPCPVITQYRVRCIASNACATIVSDEIVVTVHTADFNGDGDSGTDADIEAFFECLGGNCCETCPYSADFDVDGDIGTDADVEAFFRVLAGGNC